MKDLVIIKLFRGEYNDDFKECRADLLENKLYKGYEFARSKNKKLLFSVAGQLDIVDFGCFAEIEYTNELTQEEREFYAKLVQDFCREGWFIGEVLEDINLDVDIVFKKIEVS